MNHQAKVVAFSSLFSGWEMLEAVWISRGESEGGRKQTWRREHVVMLKLILRGQADPAVD